MIFGGEMDQHNILGGTRAATRLARFRGPFDWARKPSEQILATSDSPQLSGGRPA